MTTASALPYDQAAKEAMLVQLYRQQKLTHHELAILLKLSRFDTDALLHRYGVNYNISAQDVANEAASIRLVQRP